MKAPTARFAAAENVAADPDKYFYPDQYSNPANWQAHYFGTANEIWEQTAAASLILLPG